MAAPNPKEAPYEPRALAMEAQTFQDTVYTYIKEISRAYQTLMNGFQPRMALVLGTGLGGLVHSDEFKETGHQDFEKIPHMTKPMTPNHEGRVYWGTIEDLPVMAFSGRVQTTDFLPWNTTPSRAARLATMPLTAAKGLGVETFVLTSACGLVDSGYTESEDVNVGDVVVAADYSNYLPETNPTLADRDPRLGAAFNGRTHIADEVLSYFLRDILKRNCHVGTYNLSPSTPMFESLKDLLRVLPPWERMLYEPNSQTVVGMSMAPELDALLQSWNPSQNPEGFDRRPRILPLAIVTNKINAPQLPDWQYIYQGGVSNPASHNEVVQSGKNAEAYLIPAISELCRRYHRGDGIPF